MLLEELQMRVNKGAAAQQHIENDLSRMFGKKYKFISTAPPPSKNPDLVVNIDNKQIQFEIKSRKNKTSAIKLYERSIGRNDSDRVLDALARFVTKGKSKTFTELVDSLKSKNGKKFGFPGDEGVAKSGSVYFESLDRDVLSNIRRYIIQSLREKGDQYFVVFNSDDQTLNYYHTGTGSNPLQSGRIPNFKKLIVDTYGGAYKGKMRAGIKVVL